MSKENVALYVRMIAEKRDINQQASAARTTQDWVRLGTSAGLQFSDADVAAFVGEVTGQRVTASTAVTTLLKEMSTDQGAGTTAITFSPTLGRQMVAAGYTAPGVEGANYVEFPPDPLPHNPGTIIR